MKCPYCFGETRVTDKRGAEEANRRRRECLSCGHRFTTYERMETHAPPAIKKDGRRGQFDRSRILKIRKRDGSMADFDQNKIIDAIFNAAKAVGGSDAGIAKKLSEEAIALIEEKFPHKIPSVEDIQDAVEKVLVENGHYKTAKAFILHRQQHAKIRETKSVFVDALNTTNEYLEQTDWRVKENASEDYSFSGLMLHISGKIIANYVLNNIFTPAIAEAHKKGYFHIHDLSHGIVAYCSGWSLKGLLLKGFGGVPNKVDAKPAKHLNSAVHQMVNFFGCCQMEFAGAQAFSSVDTLLAPFVKADNLNFRQVKQSIQELVYSLNIPSRWGCQMPFTNITFDWTVPNDMKNERAIVGGAVQKFTYSDCQKEMDMINKAFLEVMMEGDAKGRIFTFPIPTYNLTKDFDWDSENANLLFDATAKYGYPYFQNYIGSNLDPSSVRSMCCRLQINMLELLSRGNGLFGSGEQTGSIGVVTINMNRLAYEAKNKERFFKMLKYYMVLAKDSLEAKRSVIEKNLKNGLMPYTSAYLGSFKTYFSTIGLCGMNEACLNLLGKNIASNEGKQLAIDSLVFMRDTLKEFQKETGNLYNLEATPAEGASYRLAKLDKEIHPDIITAGKSVPYLTNSTHLPVDFTENAIEAIKHQNDIQHLYTGGTVFHTFLGERVSSGEACKQLVKKIAFNTRIPYFSITPTFSICPEHGYIIGEHHACPIKLEKSVLAK